MATYIPRYLELLELDSDILYAQPLMNPYQLTINYQTVEEKAAMMDGALQHEAREHNHSGMLSPGILYLTYYTIGIKTDDSCKFYFFLYVRALM